MPHSSNVVELVEETLERPLGPDLISDVPRLTVEDLVVLHEAYGRFAQAASAPGIRSTEFWPVSYQLVERPRQRDQRAAARVTMNAMRQLLYAHGAIAVDPLGHLLTAAINPRRAGVAPPTWEDAASSQPSRLANYLEALAYLRPLIESGLLWLRPTTVESLYSSRTGDISFTDELQSYDAIFDAVAYSVAEGPSHYLGDFRSGKASARRAHRKMESAFQTVSRKLWEGAHGSPGDLSLETQSEQQAFTWLSCGARRPDDENLTIINALRMPALADLEPADVVALHASESWGDFRATLRRGLERAASLGDASQADGAAIIHEEMGMAERSLMSATKASAFLAARATAKRDLIIGTALAGGTAPLVGPAAAASGVGVSAARTGFVLLLEWLKARADAPEESVARCFATFQ